MNPEAIKTMLNIDLMVWNELACLLEKHPEENLHDSASPAWTARDVYAHLARWLNRNNAHIEAYCAGKELPPFSKSPEEMNDIWQKEDSVMSLTQARTKAGVALASRIAAIEAVPTERWNAEMYRLATIDGASHYAQHINYIMEKENTKH
jgi:hypothetical protein